MSDTEETFKSTIMPIITSAITTAAVVGITAGLAKYITTNYQRKDLTGDIAVKPTDDDNTISKVEVAGNETEGKIAKDGVNGTEGKIKANETEALASTAEATAAETGATAARTKAGACDIETKALKMT
ncbi:MAG: hypothetical protein MJ247_01845 [Alphaproteobacteria bacterium]|nr:hypothetical protein [Alphaproteobacteria bacterium]